MYVFLIQVNLYEEDLRLNCNVHFPYPDEPIKRRFKTQF